MKTTFLNEITKKFFTRNFPNNSVIGWKFDTLTWGPY